MSTLPERLREAVNGIGLCVDPHTARARADLVREAADEIERLLDVLRAIAKANDPMPPGGFSSEPRAKLEWCVRQACAALADGGGVSRRALASQLRVLHAAARAQPNSFRPPRRSCPWTKPSNGIARMDEAQLRVELYARGAEIRRLKLRLRGALARQERLGGQVRELKRTLGKTERERLRLERRVQALLRVP